MKTICVCIRDTVAKIYGMPNFVNSTGGAVRAFGDEINRAAEDNQLYKHSADFHLYALGTYDDETGVLVPYEVPQLLITGASLVTTKE